MAYIRLPILRDDRRPGDSSTVTVSDVVMRNLDKIVDSFDNIQYFDKRGRIDAVWRSEEDLGRAKARLFARMEEDLMAWAFGLRRSIVHINPVEFLHVRNQFQLELVLTGYTIPMFEWKP